MGLFNAAANLFGQVYERATQVAARPPPPRGGGGGGPRPLSRPGHNKNGGARAAAEYSSMTQG
ncbi:hypothetical protein ACRCQH_11335, partial [Pseudomonas aeruginosa]